MWKAIAQRYKDRKAVAAYDLLNEPVQPSGKELTDIYARIIAAIRETDRNHFLMLEGGILATDFSMFSAPADDNMVYSFHMYNFFGDKRQKNLKKYTELAAQQHVPLWAGEFGEDSYDMIQSTVEMYNDPARLVCGWCYFPWKRAPTKFPGLETIEVPDSWKRVINWIVSPTLHKKPTEEETRVGIKDFLEAVKLEHTRLDEKMVQILTESANSRTVSK
jgi:hypothetical protein